MNTSATEAYFRIAFDAPMYAGFFVDEEFMRRKLAVDGRTALPIDCLWPLYLMAKQSQHVKGDFWECGVDRGGSAKFLASIIGDRKLRLFDTFAGMPETDPAIDHHRAGDFPPMPLDEIKEYVGHGESVEYHVGRIPETFAGLEGSQIAFAHVDTDIYSATRGCCEFIYPRISYGGVMVFDDYGRPTCKGVRKAVDEYFADQRSVPLPNLINGQAVVFKL